MERKYNKTFVIDPHKCIVFFDFDNTITTCEVCGQNWYEMPAIINCVFIPVFGCFMPELERWRKRPSKVKAIFLRKK